VIAAVAVIRIEPEQLTPRYRQTSLKTKSGPLPAARTLSNFGNGSSIITASQLMKIVLKNSSARKSVKCWFVERTRNKDKSLT
jgi:hypothetical protein